MIMSQCILFFFFQAEDGIRDVAVTGVQTCAILAPDTRRALDVEKNFFEIKGCRENNLKNIDVRIPMGGLICVTGVSGSGKSTVVNQTLLPALKRKLYGSRVKAGAHKQLIGV